MSRDKTRFIRAGRGNDAAAFTFAEVLIALAVVSVSFLALIRLQLTSMKISERCGKTAQAILLANEKISELFVCGKSVSENSGRTEKNGTVFFWKRDLSKTKVAELEDVAADDLQKVVVTVEWFDGSSRRSVQLSSLMNNVDVK